MINIGKALNILGEEGSQKSPPTIVVSLTMVSYHAFLKYVLYTSAWHFYLWLNCIIFLKIINYQYLKKYDYISRLY